MHLVAGLWGVLTTLLAPAAGGPPTLLLADGPRFPRVTLVVDPADGDASSLLGLSVVEGAHIATIDGQVALEPWTVMVIVDAGPAGAAQAESLALCLRELQKSLPTGCRVGTLRAGDTLELTGASADLGPLDGLVEAGARPNRARLLDAILLAAQWAGERGGPRALLLLAAGPDGASFASPYTVSALAPYLGVPLFALQLGAAEDPLLATIATGSGGASVAVPRRDQIAVALRRLLSPLQRAVGFGYSSGTRDGTGLWQPLQVQREGEEAPLLQGGYTVPAGQECARYEPAIECPVALPPLPVALYDARGVDFRAWVLSDRALRVREGAYQAVLGTRPALRHSLSLRSNTTPPPLAALSAVRLTVPPRWPAGLPYRVSSERDGSDVGLAWSGEWLAVPPGTYSVRLTAGAAYERGRLALVAGRRTDIDLTDWATLRLGLATAAGRAAPAAVSLRSGGETRTGITNEVLLLPPGPWEATVSTRPSTVLPATTLEAGEERAIELPRLGSLRVDLRDSSGAPAQTGWIARRSDDEASAATGVTNEPADIVAGPVTVELLTTPRLRFGILVAPGEAAVHDAGRLVSLMIELLGVDGKPLERKWSLIDSGSGEPVASGVTGRLAELLPGTFDVDVWTRPHRVLHGVEIRPGLGQYLHLGQLGAIRVEGPPGARLGAYRDDSEAGLLPAAVVDSGNAVEVLPGDYLIRLVEPASSEFQQAVSVEPGKVSVLRLPVDLFPVGPARRPAR